MGALFPYWNLRGLKHPTPRPSPPPQVNSTPRERVNAQRSKYEKVEDGGRCVL